MKSLFTTTALFLALASTAHAVQICKAEKKDSRVLFCDYDPNDIYKVWSAPGAELMIQLAPDEAIINVQAADTDVIKGGWGDFIATLKFEGCALPQQVFIISHKTSNDETRPYIFSAETVPPVCARDVPAPEPDVVAKGADGVTNAAYSNGNPKNIHTLEAVPDLRHLEHPNDLAEGGHIPSIIKIRYPSDERAKREAAAEIVAKHERKRRVEQTLSAAASGIGPTTGFVNKLYVGRGDATIRPIQGSVSDDGHETTIVFPAGVALPTVTKLGNLQKGCGQEGDEATMDDSVHIDPTAPDGIRKMKITGTAAGWCLRRDKFRVYEIRNTAYDPQGHSTGTGTISPYVIRSVSGSPDAKQ